jgi:tetratricopeptide (TPR) repeat protein
MDASPERRVDQARERFALQDYYGAIHLLEELVAVGHTYADAEHMLGLCYSLVGQPEKALAHLDRSLELNPQYVEALVHRALVLNDLGREQEATDSLRRAGQIGGKSRLGFPTHLAAKLANLHAHLAEAYIEAGGMREAIGQYQAALALGPDFHDLRYKMGRLLLQAGRVLEAREQFEIIVRSRPNFQDAAAMLGLACYLSGDGLSARVVWEDCRRRRPEDPRVEAYLAMLDRGDAVGAPVELAARAAGRPEEP